VLSLTRSGGLSISYPLIFPASCGRRCFPCGNPWDVD